MSGKGIFKLVMLVMAVLACRFVYRQLQDITQSQYQALKQFPARVEQRDKALRAASVFIEGLSEFGRDSARHHTEAWVAMCSNPRMDAKFLTEQRHLYHERLQHVAWNIGVLREAGGFEAILGEKSEATTRLITFQEWLNQEAANERALDCNTEDTADTLKWLEQVVGIYDGCLRKPIVSEQATDTQAVRQALNDCMRQLDHAPPPSQWPARQAATGSSPGLRDATTPLGTDRPGDEVKKVLLHDGVDTSFVVSPDDTRVAYVVKRRGKYVAVIDGVEDPACDEIGIGIANDHRGSPVFSADSRHVAYSAKRDGQWFVVLDGRESPPYKSLWELIFSPSMARLAYWAFRDGQWWIVVNGVAQRSEELTDITRPVFSPNAARLAYVVVTGRQVFARVDGVKDPVYDKIFPPGPSFSPDSRHLGYTAQRGNKMFVVVDGRESPPYDAVLWSLPLFSPDSRHIAYGIRNNGRDSVVIDGREGPSYDFVNFAAFSPDSTRLLYLAVRNSRFLVVVDGKESTPYDSVIEPGPAFSPDSRHVGFNAKTGWKSHVVIDGNEGPTYEGISVGSPVFSPDSAHVAYVAGKEHKAFVVVDGREGPPYERITKNVIFSPDSARTAYLAQNHGLWRVVVDGSEHLTYGEILAPGPVFSPDSKHIAYVATNAPQKVVVEDGKEVGSYFDVDQNTLRFSPDSAHLVYPAWKAGWRLFVDGVEGAQRFAKVLDGPALTFDSPTRVHAIVQSDQASVPSRIDAEIPTERRVGETGSTAGP